MEFDIVDCLSGTRNLTEVIIKLAEDRRQRGAKIPKWVGPLADSNTRGYAQSVAGFITGRVAKGQFLFTRVAKSAVRRKVPEPDRPEFIPEKKLKELNGSDEVASDFRKFYSLSLPDMLLHALVGRFLRNALDPLLCDSCCAYRPGLGQPAAVKLVRDMYARGESWVVKLDVKDFNGTAEHDTLRRLLSSRLYPRLRPQERDIVSGVVEALFTLTEHLHHCNGRGLLVGSGLTPVLTNLYLLPLDELILNKGYPLVRYGDDLVAFCSAESEARRLMADLVDLLAKLKQKPSQDETFDNFWLEGYARTYGIEDRTQAHDSALARKSLTRKKTDIYPPGDPLDFIGFEFTDNRVCIRQSTLFKVQKRIQSYTQRSRTKIEKRISRDDYSWGLVFSDGDGSEETAVASIKYVQWAIQRVNTILGYVTPWPEGSPPYRVRVVFDRQKGFVSNVLRCTTYDEVGSQLMALDAYAHRRLRLLAHQHVNVAQILEPSEMAWFRWSGMDFRAMGLRTAKDVANRVPPDESRTMHVRSGAPLRS